jgi:hypothetical protein
MLSLMIEDNRQEVTAGLQALILNRTDSFADDFNTLFGTLYSRSAYMCANGCETCYKGVCGLLEVTKETSIAYGKSNFTADQILNGQIDSMPFISNFTFFLKNCVQYTSGTAFDRQLCFGVDLGNAADATSSQQMCSLEYDGVACNSCVIDLASVDGCYLADCTNIDASATIESCTGTGFVGPFVFLGMLRSDNINGSSLTLGSCDGQASPITSPVKVPTAPVAKPIAPLAEPPIPDGKSTVPMLVPVIVPSPITDSPTPVPMLNITGFPVTVPISPPAVNSPPPVPAFKAMKRMKNGGIGYQYYRYSKKGMGSMKYNSGKKKMGSRKYDAYQYGRGRVRSYFRNQDDGGSTYGKAQVMNIFAYFNP